MSRYFRGALARWAAAPDASAWLHLWRASVASPWGYLHATAWAPMRPSSRWALADGHRKGREAADSLWAAAQPGTAERVLPDLRDGIHKGLLWQLLMVANRRELFVMALWAGAWLMRSQVAAAVQREHALRWRDRLTEPLYRDVLSMSARCGLRAPALPAHELMRGRVLIDLGWSLLLKAAEDEPACLGERLRQCAGPRMQPWALKPAPSLSQSTDDTTQALLALVQRHAHAG